MPRKEIDYSKALIYKIVCRDLSVTDLYVGSTTDLCRRRACHKSKCNNPNAQNYNLSVYQFIREHGGWNAWDVVMIELFPCESKIELHSRERHFIELLGATLNSNVPTRTQKELYQEIRGEKLAWQKQHYEENKANIISRRSTKIECECGKSVIQHHKARHQKSAAHIAAIASLPHPDPTPATQSVATHSASDAPENSLSNLCILNPCSQSQLSQTAP